jgi:hypothetical protein
LPELCAPPGRSGKSQIGRSDFDRQGEGAMAKRTGRVAIVTGASRGIGTVGNGYSQI